MQAWIVGIAISFVLKEALAQNDNLDAGALKAKFEPKVRDLVPGEAFDDTCVAAVNTVIDLTVAALKDDALITKVVGLVQEGKHDAAGQELKLVVKKSWKPGNAFEKDLHKALFA